MRAVNFLSPTICFDSGGGGGAGASIDGLNGTGTISLSEISNDEVDLSDPAAANVSIEGANDPGGFNDSGSANLGDISDSDVDFGIGTGSPGQAESAAILTNFLSLTAPGMGVISAAINALSDATGVAPGDASNPGNPDADGSAGDPVPTEQKLASPQAQRQGGGGSGTGSSPNNNTSDRIGDVIKLDSLDPLPDLGAAEVQQAAIRNRRLAKLRQGRSSTVLTSSLDPAVTTKKYLLGA